MPETMTDAQTRLVERFGVLADRAGMSRIAGRIVGLLLQHPGDLSLDEIAHRLAVSRASVSTEARRLLEAGIVERVGRPGDRKDYYQISAWHFLHDLEHRFASLQELVRLLDEARRENTDPVVVARLAQSLQAHSEIMEVVGRTIARWRAEIGPAQPTTVDTMPATAGVGPHH
jgi:predicted transcriptional regulator